MSNFVKHELSKIEIPVELHDRSKLGIRKAKSEMSGKFNHFVKKRIASVIIAASLIIPTSAFAYQALLADDLYGSFENLQKHVVNVTLESYLLFDAKLNQAKGDLDKEEFEQFKDLLSIITNAKLEYGDKFGNIDYSQVPTKQFEKLKMTLYEIQPTFDKLNGLPSSKEVLTDNEYEKFIQTLIAYETLLAQLGVSSVSDISSIPVEIQSEFMEAQNYLDYVNEKQMENTF